MPKTTISGPDAAAAVDRLTLRTADARDVSAAAGSQVSPSVYVDPWGYIACMANE
jgi:hypothetical protein